MIGAGLIVLATASVPEVDELASRYHLAISEGALNVLADSEGERRTLLSALLAGARSVPPSIVAADPRMISIRAHAEAREDGISDFDPRTFELHLYRDLEARGAGHVRSAAQSGAAPASRKPPKVAPLEARGAGHVRSAAQSGAAPASRKPPKVAPLEARETHDTRALDRG